MTRPRVSIGLPVYNGAAFLGEALDSWLEQDMPDFELIACDNASTDGTPRILREYAARDARIRILTRKETVPAYRNFNGLVPEASAPVFAWSACDDIRDPSFLSALLPALEGDPGAVLVYGLTRLFGDERRVRRHAQSIDITPGDEPTALGRMISLLRTRQWWLIYGLIRTDVLRRTRLLVQPLGINADVALCLELASLGRLHCVRKRLLHFRLHSNSQTLDPEDPTNAGRRFDGDVRRFVDGLDLPAAERRIFVRQLQVWCREGERPRRFLWKKSAFRRAYVKASEAVIDLSRFVHGV